MRVIPREFLIDISIFKYDKYKLKKLIKMKLQVIG